MTRQLQGMYDSILNPAWGAVLSNLGCSCSGTRAQLFLERWPEVETLKVTVDGVEVRHDPLDGWQFDPATHSIVFSKSQVPPYGASIEVTYQGACFPWQISPPSKP